METLLKGVCSRTALLDLFENFVLFDDSSGTPVKIIGRNHQVLGVHHAVEAVRNREELSGKLGVFWHTQGSGKSYSMIFFTRMVHRKVGGAFTFVVVTDREDLDNQIYRTFAGCGAADNDRDPCRATSGDHLAALLGENKRVVFSLVQKFNRPVTKPYTDRSDVIVVTDEAHRTQYGQFALNMRNALRHASYIGFTGTPLFKDDELTRRQFGDYVSTYDFQRAVEDRATVPLLYEARGEKLKVTTTNLNARVAAALEQLEVEEDPAVRARLEHDIARDYHVITSDKRLSAIARDFVDHYSSVWETGKAMFVCIDKVTCVRMHGLITALWTRKADELEKELAGLTDDQEIMDRRLQIAWMRETEIAVVVSEAQNEVATFRKLDLDIVPHRHLIKKGFELADGKRIGIEAAFKKDTHPFRVAIVCAMWLTGFDVPSLSTLYLDKPLRTHTLMQAIARANRVYAGKANGLIVDYNGVLKGLREALSAYAVGSGADGAGGSTSPDVLRPATETLAEELDEAISAVTAFFESRGFRLGDITNHTGFARLKSITEAKEAVNETDETRKRFGVLARDVFSRFRSLTDRETKNRFASARDAIDIVYKSLQADVQQADISHILRALHGVVDDSIDVDLRVPSEAGVLYDISKIDFDRLRREFERSETRHTTVQTLKQAVEQRLARMMQQNPLRTDLQARYEEIVAAYNADKDRATIEATFEALLHFTANMGDEENRAVRSSLDEESLALFDLLDKPDLTNAERDRLKAIAGALLAQIKGVLGGLEDWRAKEATRAAVETTIYDFLYADTTGLPADLYDEAEVTDKTARVYRHVFRIYDTSEPEIYRAAA